MFTLNMKDEEDTLNRGVLAKSMCLCDLPTKRNCIKSKTAGEERVPEYEAEYKYSAN